MDYLNIIIAVLVIGLAIVRYISKVFNEPPSTATTPPIAPNKIPTLQKQKSQKPRVISAQSPTITEMHIPDEGTRVTPVPAERPLPAFHADNTSIPSKASGPLAGIRQKSEAKKAFLYAEIFNRKYE